MHIAFINPQGNFDPQDSYWTQHPDFGGQLVYVKEVAIQLALMNHQVDIITRQIIDPEWPEFSARIDRYPEIDNLRIVRLPCGPNKFLNKEELWPYLGTEWINNIQSYYQDDSPPDIFTTHYGDGGLCGVFLNQQIGVPFTFTGHSLGAQKMDKLGITPASLADFDQQYKFSRRIAAERVSMNRCSCIFTSTKQERNVQYGHHAYREAVNPNDDSHFSVTPPGVNRQIFSTDMSELDQSIEERFTHAMESNIPKERYNLPLILASSRLDPKKNHIGILQAFIADPTLQMKANIALVVSGIDDPLHNLSKADPNERKVLREIISLIDTNNLREKVFSILINNQKELAAAYRYAASKKSIFILTALYEPFGLAPLEAMSCGLPVVVTKNGGPSESMIDKDNEYGVLVDPKDPKDIALGIIRLIGNESEWYEFHHAGIKRVISKYTWKRTAEGYLQMFRRILTDKLKGYNTEKIPDYFTNPNESDHTLINQLAALYFN